MVDSAQDIILIKDEYKDIFSEGGISVGTALIIQNKSNSNVHLQISETQPSSSSTDGYLMLPDENFKVLVQRGASGLWGIGGGPISISIDTRDYAFYADNDWEDIVSSQDLIIELEANRFNDVSGDAIALNAANLDPDNTLNVGPGVYWQLIKKSEDISDGVVWDFTQIPILTATTFLANAQEATIYQNISTLDSTLYNISFKAKIEAGGQTTGYQFRHRFSETGNQTDLTLTEDMEQYNLTILGASGGGTIQNGFRDSNTSNWSLVTITDFQVTQSSYRLPYAPNDSAVSTLPIPTNSSNGGGYSYAIDEDLRNAFDGVADGVEEVVNGDTEAALPTIDLANIDNNNVTSTQSIEQAHSGLKSIKAVKTNTTTGAATRFINNSNMGLSDGNFETSVWVFLPSGQAITSLQLRWRNGDASVTILDSTIVTDTWIELKGRVKDAIWSDGSADRILWVTAITDTVSGEYWYIDDQSVKQISPAQGQLVIPEWRPKFDFDQMGSSSAHLITLINNAATAEYLLRHRIIGVMQLTDVTNIASVTPNYQANIPYRITAKWGPKADDTLSAEKVVNGDFADASSTDSSIAPLAGFTNDGTHNATNKFTIIGGECRIISDGTFTAIGQLNSLVLNTEYQVSIDLTDASSGGIVFRNGATDIQLMDSVKNWTFTFTADNVGWDIKRNTGITDVTFDNVSIKATNQPKMQLIVEELDPITKAVVQTFTSPVVDFDGSFNPGDFMKFGFDNDEWFKLGTNPYILKEVTW